MVCHSSSTTAHRCGATYPHLHAPVNGASLVAKPMQAHQATTLAAACAYQHAAQVHFIGSGSMSSSKLLSQCCMVAAAGGLKCTVVLAAAAQRVCDCAGAQKPEQHALYVQQRCPLLVQSLFVCC